MAFSQITVDQAFNRSGGKCECTRSLHNHLGGRCGALLMYKSRGREGLGAWEANHINRVESDGADSLSNCEILCWPCHRATLSQ